MDGKLFELVTNIKSESKHFDFDELYGSKLIAEVKSNIDNWPVFKEILGEYRAMVNAETFSLKGVISSFMSEIGEDKIKDIAKQAQELTEKIQESPIGSLVEESKNEKKNI